MGFDSNSAKKAGSKSSRKGVSNKATRDLRELLKGLLDDQYGQIVKDLKRLDPKDRVNAYIRLIEYAIPKMQKVEQTVDVSTLTDEQVDELFNRLTKKFD